MRKHSNVESDQNEAFRSVPEMRGGIACFTGTRVGVSQLLGYLRDGYNIDDFLNDFPTVTKEQAQRAIERIEEEYLGGIKRKCAQEHNEGTDKDADNCELGPEGRHRDGSGAAQ